MKGDTLDQNGNCKVCGSKPHCLHNIGSSGNNSVDDFRLICPKCGEIDQFVHVDMCGNDIETCPWCGQPASQNRLCVWYVDGISEENPVKNDDDNTIHLVDKIRVEEDQNGDEGNAYITKCRQKLNGWANSASPIGKTGTLEEAKKTGLDFCKSCF
jgi:hypothetical protein